MFFLNRDKIPLALYTIIPIGYGKNADSIGIIVE